MLAHTHRYAHTHTHIHTHTHTHTYMLMHTHIHSHAYTLHAHTYTHTHTHTCLCTHTHIHHCTHTHMHVCMPTLSPSLSLCTCFLASDWRSHSVMLRTSPEQMSVELSCSQCVTNPDPMEIQSAICKLLTATFCIRQWHPFSTQPPSRWKVCLQSASNISAIFWSCFLVFLVPIQTEM